MCFSFSSLTIAILEFLVYTCLKATKHGKSNVRKRWKREMSKSLVRSLACGAGADLERESSDDNDNQGYNKINDGTTIMKTVGLREILIG